MALKNVVGIPGGPSGFLIAVQHPDGRYDDFVNNVFKDEAAIEDELKRPRNKKADNA